MKTYASILALLIASMAWAGAETQPATAPASQPARDLQFRVVSVSQAIEWPGRQTPQDIIRPGWAAEVAFQGNAGDLYGRDSAASWVQNLGSTIEGLSEKQRAFLQQHLWPTFYWDRDYTYTYTFFAVSEEDARQMARQFIRYIDGRAQDRLEYTRERLVKAKEMLEKAPRQIDEYNAQYKQVNEQMDRLCKSLGIEENEDMAGWTRTVEECKASLRALDVERTGQLARLRAIQQYMAQQTQPASNHPGQATSSQPNPAVLSSLETMLVELNVEMAGTQARREAIEKYVAPWQELLALAQARRKAANKEVEWKGYLKGAREDMEELPRALAIPNINMRPASLKDDTVQIVPVEASVPQPRG